MIRAIFYSIFFFVLLLPQAAPAAAPPGIVIILSDDMGWSDIGCYGGEIRTPSLDALASEGLRFTQFYNTARCCPTRASLLTGLYPHQAGMGHMTDDRRLPGYPGDLGRHTPTIAEALRGAGYRSYLSGKWHVTRHDGPRAPNHNWPLQRGFEKFYGTIKGGGSFYDPTSLCRGNAFITPVSDPEYQPEVFYYTDAISDNAVKFLREHHAESPEKPFFLYVAYTAAHWPMHALEEDIARYRGKYDGGYGPTRAARLSRLRELGLVPDSIAASPQVGDWETVKDKAWEARCMEVYAAMVESMDRGIGRIVGELMRQGRLDDTLVLYLQDNGGCAENMGRGQPREPFPTDLQPLAPDELQPSIWPPMRTRDGRAVRTGPGVMPGPADTYIGYGRDWANVSNTPFREYKHWVHEGGISTPLIARWPRGIPASRSGKLVRDPGHLIDLMATCLEAAGAKLPAEWNGAPTTPLEGVSLLPALAGRPLERPAPIFFEHEGNRAVRDGKWKLVAKGARGPWELYDMEADRAETKDLAASRPELVEALSGKWTAWAERARVLPWPWEPREERPDESGKKMTAAAAGAGAAESPRPNVLLIVADDLGWGDVGWHGARIRTPNMDRLAREGVELDRHYVQPVCTPTRAALLTGRYPSRFGPQALTPSNRRALPPGTETLATALRAAGYTTYQAGKWHLGSRQEWGPNAHGFQKSYGSLTGAVDPWKHTYRSGPYEKTWHRDGERLDEEGNATELVAAQAVRWIEEKRSPWFIYVAFHAVHIPIDAPEEHKRIYAGERFDDDPERDESYKRFAAFTTQMDARIGDFVRALERTGQKERTLIVFTSDNGGLQGGGNAYVSDVPPTPRLSSNAPLRGQKGQLYEGGIRVPAFASWPGVLGPRKLTAPLHAVDWMPTLVKLAGWTPPRDLAWDGRDIWPLLSGAIEKPAPRTLYWPYAVQSALLDGDWKLIERRPRPAGKKKGKKSDAAEAGSPDGPRFELYDLAADPFETDDRAAAEPDRLARLREKLDSMRRADVTKLPADLEGIPN